MMPHDEQIDKYISARTWAARWDCSPSTVRRAAERFGVSRVYVGEGANGLVRYALEDIERIEGSNSHRPVQWPLARAPAEAAHESDGRRQRRPGKRGDKKREVPVTPRRSRRTRT